MVRKHALINDNIVTAVQVVSDDAYEGLVLQNQALVDIEDMIPEPQVGWLLEGNVLVPPQSQMTPDQLDVLQQLAQRKFGEKLLPNLVDMVGSRNLKFIREGTVVDVATLASQMASIKLLLETGALKTVRGLCAMMKPAFSGYADIFDYVIAEITNFLANNGWN